MSELTLVDPKKLDRNPENPRLIFRPEELHELENSIANQGILVPLTVYKRKKGYVILDGERRWRCALKLGLSKVPVIVQPEPDKLQNVMMMFAIHNARKDWDPLPTAYKLAELEGLYEERQGKPPTERELAELASMTVGEVRRLRKLLALPGAEREELMKELEKPRSEQRLTADQVLEAVTAAARLRKENVIAEDEEAELRRAIVDKFRQKVLRSTVEPRKLARMARAVQREELDRSSARKVVKKLIRQPKYSIDQAFTDSVERLDFQHNLVLLIGRTRAKLEEHEELGYDVTVDLQSALDELVSVIKRLLRR